MKLYDGQSSEDEANSRVAAYESYLDLFTLLSFILIVSAFVLVNKSVRVEQVGEVASVVPKNAPPVSAFGRIASKSGAAGAGTPGVPQQDQLYIIMHNEDGRDMLTVIDGSTNSQAQVITVENVDAIMAGMVDQLNRAKTIFFTVYQDKRKKKKDVNPKIYFDLARWLSDHNYSNCRVSFYTEDE